MLSRIVVEYPESDFPDNHRIYHFMIRASKSLIDRLHPTLISENPDYYERRVGSDAWTLVEELLAMPGVAELCSFTHAIEVFNVEGAPWDELEPKILEILKNWLKEEGIMSEPSILRVSKNKITPDLLHPDDSSRAGFLMPA